MNYYIGVDVGTGSARAGIFDSKGKQICSFKKDITTWSYDLVYKQQSSKQIWESICEVVKKCLETSKINKNDIKGIGFDATCSLVAVNKNGEPVTLSKSGEDERNIILWMDHRANIEADFINLTNHEVLEYVGGKVSLEMEIPKLLWVKKNLVDSYDRTAHFFDLPDYLTYKATGKLERSLCSLGCKWNYMNHESKWNLDYLQKIGFEDICENLEKIGTTTKNIGESLEYLSEKSAEELGLTVKTIVGVSMIDAHAGGIGVLGIDDREVSVFNERIALIGGTSSCHMAVTNEKIKVSGVWGPYYGAMLPNKWLLEGGQSATGALIDFVIKSHSAYNKLESIAKNSKVSVYEKLNEILFEKSKKENIEIDRLTNDFHMLPYYHGNRSPRANANLKGMVIGLTLDDSLDNLAIYYLSAIQSVAYGTRHIIEEMNNNGFNIKKIFMTGGGTKNPLFLSSHSNITGCSIILGEEDESVLLGSAILGAVASGEYSSIEEGMKNMSKFGEKIEADLSKADYHNKKYRVFKEMYNDFIKYREIME